MAKNGKQFWTMSAMSGLWMVDTASTCREVSTSVSTWRHSKHLTKSGSAEDEACCWRATLQCSGGTTSYFPPCSGVIPDSSTSSYASWTTPWSLSFSTVCLSWRLKRPTLPEICIYSSSSRTAASLLSLVKSVSRMSLRKTETSSGFCKRKASGFVQTMLWASSILTRQLSSHPMERTPRLPVMVADSHIRVPPFLVHPPIAITFQGKCAVCVLNLTWPLEMENEMCGSKSIFLMIS